MTRPSFPARYCKRSSLGLFGSGNETRDGYRCIPDWRSMHPGWRSQYPWMAIKDGDRYIPGWQSMHPGCPSMHPWLAINHPRMTIDASRDRISRDGIPGWLTCIPGICIPGCSDRCIPGWRAIIPGCPSMHPGLVINHPRMHMASRDRGQCIPGWRSMWIHP